MSRVPRNAFGLARLAVAVSALTWHSFVLADEFVDQPPKQHSNICCTQPATPPPNPKAEKSVLDDRFATKLHQALQVNNFHSLVVTFAECYGGGMIDDVADEFADSNKPISMTSGSKYDECSGSAAPTSQPNNGFSRWSQAYSEVHPGKTGNTNNNPTEDQAYANAKTRNAWTQSNPAYTAQQKTLNNGGAVKLGDGTNGSGATSYHAILFVGVPDGRPDYWNDIVRQHRMLSSAGFPTANIKTYYGGGTAPSNAAEPSNAVSIDGAATVDSLLNAISALSGVMDPNEQLYIYIGDHGSPDQSPAVAPAQPVPASPTKNSQNTFNYDPPFAAFVAALQNPTNSSGPYVEINIASSSIVDPNWEVFFNDLPVNNGDNTIPPSDDGGAYRFSIDPADVHLAASNDIWLRNASLSVPPIEVQVFFSAGDIPVQVEAPVVPTLSQWGLIVLALLLLTAGTLVVGRQRRRRVAA